MITVLSPGILSTVQDLGRLSYAAMGVPIAGVMDSFSAGLANQIIGNSSTDAVIEVTFGGCTLRFECDTVICISGADFSAQVNDRLVDMHTPIKIEKGAVLAFGKQQRGVRTYIGVLGGIQSEKVLGSRSYFAGITANNKLYKGQEIKICPLKTKRSHSSVSITIDAQLFSAKKLSAFKGPEFEWLTAYQKEQLQQTLFAISKDNSRMGYQLVAKIENNFSSMLTAAVMPGTVQLTPSGTLIILMKDGQVTGGYPRILQLSAPAINALAQKATGQDFQFVIND